MSDKYKNKFLTFPFEIKEAKEQDDEVERGIIKGYASTFGNVDQGLDVVVKGAFKKSIRDNKGKFPILADHNPSKQIGLNLEAEEDDRGLFVKGQLDIDNNQAAKEKFSLVKMALEHGADAGMSIGFMNIQSEPDPDRPAVRLIKEVKLFEYSLVAFPMNTEAMATAVKHWVNTEVKELTNESLEKYVELFLETAQMKGYDQSQIHKALARAAKKHDPSEKEAQSVIESLKSLKQKMN